MGKPVKPVTPRRPAQSGAQAPQAAQATRTTLSSQEVADPIPVAVVAPWLDSTTAAQVDAIVLSVMTSQPNLRAAILFGSIARHDERPLDDAEPSDVDLLLLFDPTQPSERLPFEERLAISHAIVQGMRQQPDAAREVNVFTGVADLSEWHEDFLANLIKDGEVLWARRPLPLRITLLDQRVGARH